MTMTSTGSGIRGGPAAGRHSGPLTKPPSGPATEPIIGLPLGPLAGLTTQPLEPVREKIAEPAVELIAEPVTEREPRPKAVAATMVIIALIAFVTTLDNNIVAAAVPSMGRELGLSMAEVQWVVIGYMLPFAGLLLVAGTLVDRWGQRRSLLLGLLVFGGGALLGGVAGDATTLIGARVLQGAAAAVIMPGALSLLRTGMDAKRRAVGTAVWTAFLALAIAAGPAVGGALSEYLHWSWIFYSNVPFVVVAAILVPIAAGDSRTMPTGRIDISGMVLATTAMTSFTMAMVSLGESSVSAVEWPIPAGIGVATAVGFLVSQRYAAQPLVPKAVLAQRAFVGGVLVQLLWGLGVTGIVFFTPLVYQESLRLSPTEAGMPLIAAAVGLILVTPFVPAVVARWGPRTTVVVGLALVAAGLALLALVNHIPSVPPRIPGLLFLGVGSALTTPLTTFALDMVAEEHAGVASGLLTASRELSSALGVAFIGALITLRQTAELDAGAPADRAISAGFTAAYLGAAIVELLAAWLTLRVFGAGVARAAEPAPDWSPRPGEGRGPEERELLF
jgi:EmrB/QacA subfamily drug resistance transporter